MSDKAATPNHFLDLDKLTPAVLRGILDDAEARRPGGPKAREKPFDGQILACIFEKPSTRTRLSFDIGIRQLGGESVIITPAETQLGRGETIADTARVLSRYVDAIMIRTTKEETLLELAEFATVPVINGLTDRTHPCQLMADVMTFEQHLGPIAGRTVTWSGDGNNMATSWIHAAVQFGFTLRIACPEQLPPPADVLEWAKKHGNEVVVTNDAAEAVKGSDCVVTDVWVSMGDEGDDQARSRHNMLKPFQVDDALMAKASPNAIFMHCLPAHRGEEVTASVIDGPRSVVWDEAENRLHAQKGILAWCMT